MTLPKLGKRQALCLIFTKRPLPNIALPLNGIIEDKFVFDNLPNDFNTLDLMQSVPELYVERGALISYNFFHLANTAGVLSSRQYTLP